MAGCGFQTVPADALLPPQEQCPVCGADHDVETLLVLQDSPRVTLDQCRRCHAASASQLPTDAFLSALYDPATYSSSLVSDSGLSRRCAASILKDTPLDPDQDVEILDYGGSDGTLSREVRRQIIMGGHRGEVRSTVVDIFPREATEHQRFIDPDAFDRDPTRYQLLMASAVLEHLKDVRRVVTSMVEHAAPGAFFYARTPYDAPLSAITSRYKIKWPRHLHDMGPAFWDHFGETFGADLEVVRSQPSIVETTMKQAGARTLAAHIMKVPARLENSLLRPALGYQPRLWHWVGGWEVVFRLQ